MMALDTTPTPIAALRSSYAVLHGRKPDQRTEVAELRMEIRAAGFEMCAMAHRISNALTVGDSHSAMHFAARLWVLGNGYADPDGQDAA